MLVNTGKTPCTDRMSPVHMYIFKASYHAPGAHVSLVLYASTHRIIRSKLGTPESGY